MPLKKTESVKKKCIQIEVVKLIWENIYKQDLRYQLFVAL